MLEINNVSKSFRGKQVLEPTSLTIEPARTTVLIGPSGCGKSTLLRLLIGQLQPDQGEVRFHGELLTAENVIACRQQMGFVMQDGGLFPHLTAEQNTALLARYLKRDESWIRTRVADLSDLTRLPKDLLNRYPHQLSGGQRQRVGMMRALVLDPAVLLLDEPMGALDPLVRYDLQEDLKNIFQALNKTVVLVTHDLGEAGFLGDQVLLMGAGRIVQRGSLESLIESPADDFVRKFLQAQRLPTGRVQ